MREGLSWQPIKLTFIKIIGNKKKYPFRFYTVYSYITINTIIFLLNTFKDSRNKTVHLRNINYLKAADGFLFQATNCNSKAYD